MRNSKIKDKKQVYLTRRDKLLTIVLLSLLMIGGGLLWRLINLDIHADTTYPDEAALITEDGQYYLNIDNELCYYTESLSDAASYVRMQLTEHEKNIRVTYGVSGQVDEEALWDQIDAAVYSEAEEGTYLKLSTSGQQVRVVDTGTTVKGTDKKVYFYDCQPYYYTSAEQEREIEGRVKSLATELSLKGDSDYDKVKKIYQYICQNVEYDWDFNNMSFYTYGALINKKAVCQGYALLFYRIGKEAGLDVDIVIGKGLDGIDDSGEMFWIDHAWNTVDIKGARYYLDATWDSMESPYNYFLKGYESFCEEHKSETEDTSAVSAKDYEIPEQDRLIFDAAYDPSVQDISIKGLSHKIAAGRSLKLSAVVKPDSALNKKLFWKSSNTKIATVSQTGKVTLKKKSGGRKVTITATAKDGSGMEASWDIKSMKGAVKKVAIKGKKSVKAGKKLKLKAVVKASKKANKKVKWLSNNKAYATVDASGRIQTFKAGKGKKVRITAMATDGTGKKKTVKISIK